MDWDTMIVVLGEPGTTEEMQQFHKYLNEGWEMCGVRAVGGSPLRGNTTLSYWRRPSTHTKG